MRKKSPQKQPKNKSNDGFIRIISGQFRGRKLPVKDVQGLRPTTDRIKETVFNWLMQDTRDARVLDCFAGSGGLGFEALSRFAHCATFLEMDNSATAQLKTNAQTLNLNNAEIFCTDSLRHLSQNPNEQQFDLVFVDPPFRQNLAQPCCDLLIKNSWLSENALIYVEVESELYNLDLPSNWLLLKEKTAGQVQCQLYQVQ
ncbi:16S rRNA (guanine(966)-N(2))-methyltransferase RsmD [Pseudoalteromonas sp. H105]|uniref:16S rRNA (guanine(966)-N(2))-methyltransferase RsmD n=1 Tax=Pseudoalteromonas sp. H105 TaxID=1348393 RepID=UPI000731EFC0|nr:16S rRNA (guanine(966)-N(2))-methyltransferase RsmD [Pseudoalteromonas sp. H105]KTF12152.1 16S rRNA (guanine(966)-N(2))-methyltransferase RsmD [Pseudoalteromonas sp. H105]